MSTAIRELRYFTNAPLLVLGYRGNEMEVVTSLESGADDYVRMPCDLTELMVRVWVLLRRAGVPSPHRHEEPLSSGSLFINPATYEVFLGGTASYADINGVSAVALVDKEPGGRGNPSYP
jgi:two-component system KDP operon response regulator KdpE